MQSNRREFLAAGMASLSSAGAAATFGHRAAAAEGDVADAAGVGCLDYGLSFICNPSMANAVRFWIECRTTLYDDAAGSSIEFYQCGSCKSENTFAEKDLLKTDNYDFLPIFGGDDLLIFRRPAGLSDSYRQVIEAEAVWGKPILKLRDGKRVQVLDTFETIRDATAAGIPIVTQTEIKNEHTGLRAIIECPVKTMNVSLDRSMYQVDTGPVAFPDLTKRYDRPIECLSLAFVAFNAPHFADFVIEQPTPVVEDGVEKCRVYHYSQPFSLPARNRVLSVALPE